jgi:hypothetical protein
VLTQQSNLKKGSIKIDETAIMVANLKIELEEKKPELIIQEEKTAKALISLKDLNEIV